MFIFFYYENWFLCFIYSEIINDNFDIEKRNYVLGNLKFDIKMDKMF